MSDQEQGPDPKKAAGGRARANALSPEDRSAIARRAALSRHGLRRAIAEGSIILGDLRIPCAVLDDSDNTRVLTQEGFLEAIGRAGKAKGGEGATVDGLPAFLRAANLKPFIPNDLIASTIPIEFAPLRGPGYQGRAFGYRASLLPGVCWVYQDALVARKLFPSQKHIGEACKVFLKALTNYAIDDLVDRATGFEDIRKRRAIEDIIKRYVQKDAQKWVLMFDMDFYRHIFRLNGWAFNPETTARPGVIGHWTNDIYDRLAPGITSELHSRVRRNEKGRPTEKIGWYLTPEEGKPSLKALLEGVKLLMRMSATWDEFKIKLDEYYPSYKEAQMKLPLERGVFYLPTPKD